MKKIFLFIILAAGLVFGQTTVEPKTGVKLVSYQNAFTLSSSANVYSDPIDMWGDSERYLPADSTKPFWVSWSVTDTVIADITLEGRKNTAGKLSGWTTIGTIYSKYNGYGNDSLYSRAIYLNGTWLAGSSLNAKAVSIAGFNPDQIRVKIAYGSKTTVGNGGNFKVWVTLPKQ